MNSHYNGSQGFFTHPEKKTLLKIHILCLFLMINQYFGAKKNII